MISGLDASIARIRSLVDALGDAESTLVHLRLSMRFAMRLVRSSDALVGKPHSDAEVLTDSLAPFEHF